VCVILCTIFRLIVVLFCVMCVVCVLCLIVVPLPPGETPFAVKISNKNNTINRYGGSFRPHWPLGSTQPLTEMSTRNL
jgi:hypothetical protein